MNDKVFSIIFIIILTITNIIAVILVTGILLFVVALILAKVKPDAMAFFSPVVLLIGILVGTKLYQKLVMKLIRKKGWERRLSVFSGKKTVSGDQNDEG